MSLDQFLANFFKVLSHPLRLQVVELLSKNDKSVSELQTITLASETTLSQQLAILRQLDLVTTQKNGKYTVYTLKSKSDIKKLLATEKLILQNQLSGYE